MAKAIWQNNATSKMTGTLSNAATTMTFTAADDAKFPAPTGGDWFTVVLTKVDGTYEIITVTQHTGGNGTFNVINRAQEGTSALTFSSGDVTNGVKVELSPTAAALAALAIDSTVVHLAGTETITGVKTFSVSSGGDFALFQSTQAGSEAAVRNNATQVSSGISYKLSNSGLNNQVTWRINASGETEFYVGQTAGAGSTAGILALKIGVNGGIYTLNAVGGSKGQETININNGIYDNGHRLAKVLISVTPITSTSFQITSDIDNTFDEYELSIVNLTQANNSNYLRLTVFEAGPTEKTGASDYKFASAVCLAGTGVTSDSNNSEAFISLVLNGSSYQLSNNAARTANYTIRFFKPASTTSSKYFQFKGCYITDGDTFVNMDGSGVYRGTTNAIIGIKVTNGGGNMTGNAYLYGIRKS